MQELKFYIVGGYIKIAELAFSQEMLGQDNCLHRILNWKGTKDIKDRHPKVGEPDETGMITIDFGYTGHIELGQSAMDILNTLKTRYGDKVKGRVCCRWLAGYSMSNFVIDLDTNKEKIAQEI